jgi:hypothetical protein
VFRLFGAKTFFFRRGIEKKIVLGRVNWGQNIIKRPKQLFQSNQTHFRVFSIAAATNFFFRKKNLKNKNNLKLIDRSFREVKL